MGDYTATTIVSHDVTDAFDYISDPEHLPEYFPRMTEAHEVEAGTVRTTAVVDADQDGSDEKVVSDAWFKADDADHSISWGSPGTSDYHGTLRLLDADGSGTRVELSLTTPHDFDGMQQSLDESLAAIASRLDAIAAEKG